MLDLVGDDDDADAPKPAEDLTATFVGAETYTDQSRPMGLAALMGLDLNDDEPVSATPSTRSKERLISPRSVVATSVVAPLVGAKKQGASRPMGLFGLLEAEGNIFSPLWCAVSLCLT